MKVSCDVNYRSKLWSAEEAREVISELISDLDLLLVGQGDLQTLWKRSGNPEKELRRLQDEFRIADVVMTRGPEGAIGLFGDAIHQQEAFASEVVSPIGAGDAFLAVTALLLALGGDTEDVGFIGNVVGGIKIRLIGHSACIQKGDVKKSIISLLK